jgi:hypothetical protein
LNSRESISVNELEEESIAIQRAFERLRQERETFDQQKTHDNRWFGLRLAIGVVAVVILPVVVGICGYVLIDGAYSETVQQICAVALVGDVVALVGAVFKIVLSPASITQLAPVTTSDRAVQSDNP